MEEQKWFVCQQLADLVEAALIDEVELAPKPGLVDPLSSGVHQDMDHRLFLVSAKTLTPFFEEMAQAGWQEPLTQTLRETIASIGRRAETAMLTATNGINTHKGAIWALGLFITVVSSQYSRKQSLFLPEIFSDIQTLVSFADRQGASINETHGQTVKQKYGRLGAFGEAATGYPHVQIALADYFSRDLVLSDENKLHMLLAIIAHLDDTCILYRSAPSVLANVQSLASIANQEALPNQAFQTLDDYCQQMHVSPGGSADLLAVSLFLLSLTKRTVSDSFVLPYKAVLSK